MRIDRRDFLRYAAGASTALAGTRLLGLRNSILHAQHLDDGCILPAPQDSGIEHIVFIMMENRSFDHFMGWLPNADGIPPDGLSYLDRDGNPQSIYTLAPDYTGQGHPDPDHSYAGSRVAYDSGAMDGFLLAGTNDLYCIGYYVESDHSAVAQLARQYMTCDRYFGSVLGPTFPNRFFAHSAQTDRLDNSIFPFSTLPTIWDSLAATGVTGLYYAQGTPFLLEWGFTKYQSITRTWQQFLNDAAAGTLPSVAFVDPDMTHDDHPTNDIRDGDDWLNQTFSAIQSGPAWPSTVVVITWDEGGGFFDHVAPPRAAAPNGVDPDIVDGRSLLGFRVPTIIASPFSVGSPNNPLVSSLPFDHTSVLELIEWRWGVPPLTARDGSDDVSNIACALNFGS